MPLNARELAAGGIPTPNRRDAWRKREARPSGVPILAPRPRATAAEPNPAGSASASLSSKMLKSSWSRIALRASSVGAAPSTDASRWVSRSCSSSPVSSMLSCCKPRRRLVSNRGSCSGDAITRPRAPMKGAGAGGKTTVHVWPTLFIISMRVSTFVPIAMPTPSSVGSPGRAEKVRVPPPLLRSLGDAAAVGSAASRTSSSPRIPTRGFAC